MTWREGSNDDMTSRFARVRVRPAHQDYKRTAPHPEEWLLVEWPEGEAEPTKHWFSTLPDDISLAEMVDLTKLRWRIERDYQDLKQEVGLGHYEGRGWRGFHHHATLCIAAYGFLISERETIPPSGPDPAPGIGQPALSQDYRPRGAPGSTRTARPQLHRYTEATLDNRPRQEPPTLPMLPRLPQQNSGVFMTVVLAAGRRRPRETGCAATAKGFGAMSARRQTAASAHRRATLGHDGGSGGESRTRRCPAPRVVAERTTGDIGVGRALQRPMTSVYTALAPNKGPWTAADRRADPTGYRLGDSSTVEQRTLTPSILVRIQVPQPKSRATVSC